MIEFAIILNIAIMILLIVYEDRIPNNFLERFASSNTILAKLFNSWVFVTMVSPIFYIMLKSLEFIAKEIL